MLQTYMCLYYCSCMISFVKNNRKHTCLRVDRKNIRKSIVVRCFQSFNQFRNIRSFFHDACNNLCFIDAKIAFYISILKNSY